MRSLFPGSPLVSHPARLSICALTLKAVTGLVARARRSPSARPWQRAATVHVQVLLVVRWLRWRIDLLTLARDAGISIATAYRYLHEGLEAIADQAPELNEVLQRAHRSGEVFVCLDGTLVPTDRVAARTPRGNDAWYSGKHRHHGGNLQVITDSRGFPIWISPVSPGATHDLAAARTHALGALYPHAALRPGRLAVLADAGYRGAGIGIHTPFHRPAGNQDLDPDNRAHNQLITALRAPAERAHALLTERWAALRHVSLDPWRITTIAAAVLVLITLDRGHR
ncbi:transposase family protein [Quadrisphaera sp. DSM 44207]|uniref:transposase family protein n=1 Tax=Quadrisphaera sp. DSM 44207 TaxID=1881057 RepID=UPI00350F6918